MKISLSAAVLSSVLAAGDAFLAPATPARNAAAPTVLLSTTIEAEAEAATTQVVNVFAEDEEDFGENHDHGPIITGAEFRQRLAEQLEKLRQKDSTSPQLSKQDIKVVFEDDHIIVVNKPGGVLTVAGKNTECHSLAQSVYDAFGCDELQDADSMIVHRLGMDTSGLIVIAKSVEAVRGMNTVFRTRKIERKYEALVCGHIEKEQGLIDLPLMRDYEFPPFMRVSTENHQRVIADLETSEIGKKYLERPKESLTYYRVIGREEFDGEPVTRVSMTSISGRTHQLNVHMAAFGHPIVGDTTYGINGMAASNGGLSDAEAETLIPNPTSATTGVQKRIAKSAQAACVHAKSLKFRHPVTKEIVSFSIDAPF